MAKQKYYAVVKGNVPGVYDVWAGPGGAEVQIKGLPGAVYKGFASLGDAEAWFAERAGQPPARRLTQPAPEQVEASARVSAEEALAAGKVVLFTDGGCLENPGPGGYGAVLRFGAHRKELSGGFARTTNNRMELTACIAGLGALSRASEVEIFTDSRYLANGISKGWAARWRENGWLKSDGEPPENADLWAQVLDLCEQHTVNFNWLKGHAGSRENERCDALASAAMRKPALPPDHGFSG